LPLVFQQAGWFTPTFSIVLIFILSSFAATMLCEAIQLIPGNHHFEKRLHVNSGFRLCPSFFQVFIWFRVGSGRVDDTVRPSGRSNYFSSVYAPFRLCVRVLLFVLLFWLIFFYSFSLIIFTTPTHNIHTTHRFASFFFQG
jgi:hypothetical protein